MKLIQLNIWQARLLKQALNFIDKEKPDILCLQEIFSSQSTIPIPSDTFNSFELILNKLCYDYSFFSPIYSSTYAESPISFGQAIISRYPLNNKEVTPIHYENKNSPNNTVLQTCEVSLGSSLFSLANHHGYWVPNEFGDEKTVQNMQLVNTELSKTKKPLIFAGDLNVVSESPAMRVFDNTLIDLTAKFRVKSTLSELGKIKNVACDHILVSSDIVVNDFSVSDDLISDHKALILNFDIS